MLSNQPIATFYSKVINIIVLWKLSSTVRYIISPTNDSRSSRTRTDILRYNAVLPLNYWAIEVWREPVHCSLFFQYRHDTCTMLRPNHTHRTQGSLYAGTLIGARYQCAIRKLYRSSRSTSHRSSIEYSPRLTWTGPHAIWRGYK